MGSVLLINLLVGMLQQLSCTIMSPKVWLLHMFNFVKIALSTFALADTRAHNFPYTHTADGQTTTMAAAQASIKNKKRPRWCCAQSPQETIFPILANGFLEVLPPEATLL